MPVLLTAMFKVGVGQMRDFADQKTHRDFGKNAKKRDFNCQKTQSQNLAAESVICLSNGTTFYILSMPVQKSRSDLILG